MLTLTDQKPLAVLPPLVQLYQGSRKLITHFYCPFTDRPEATGVPFPLCYSNKEVVNCYPLSFSFYQKHIFPRTIALIVPVFTEQKRYWQQHWYARRWIHRFSGPAWVSIQEQPLKYIHFSKEGDFLIKGFHEQSGQVFCFPVRARLNRDGRFLLTFSIFY